jgi:hypothetical protein
VRETGHGAGVVRSFTQVIDYVGVSTIILEHCLRALHLEASMARGHSVKFSAVVPTLAR